MHYQSQVHLRNDSLVPEDKFFFSLSPVNQAMGTFCLFNTENPRGKGKKKRGVGPSQLFARHYRLGPRAALCLLQQARAAGAENQTGICTGQGSPATGATTRVSASPSACAAHHLSARNNNW